VRQCLLNDQRSTIEVSRVEEDIGAGVDVSVEALPFHWSKPFNARGERRRTICGASHDQASATDASAHALEHL
jgi:hypothetical protein